MIFKFIKDWRDGRKWLKEYGEPMPDWVKNNDLSFFNTKEFQQWISKRTPEQQNLWNRKIQIINSELDRFQFAIEDEIVKRGGVPEIE